LYYTICVLKTFVGRLNISEKTIYKLVDINLSAIEKIVYNPMITKIKMYLESLSSERERDAKLQILVELGKQAVESYKKMKEYEELKKQKNAEIKEMLETLEKTSYIAEGVLIEVTKPYVQQRLNKKEYFDFVENSIGLMHDDFKNLSNQMKALATKLIPANTTLRFGPNTGNKATGTIKYNESLLGDVWDLAKDWFAKFKRFFMSSIERTNRRLERIKAEAAKFNTEQPVAESFSDDDIDETILEPITGEAWFTAHVKEDFDYTLDKDVSGTVMLYVRQEFLNFDLGEDNTEIWNSLNHNFEVWCDTQDLFYPEVTTADEHDGTKSLVFSAETRLDESLSTRIDRQLRMLETISEEERLARNKYSREYKMKRRQQDKALANILDTAKDAIEAAKQETYYAELLDLQERQIIQLLQELNAKSVAIEDKLLSLVNNREKEDIDINVYQEKMKAAENVHAGVEKMVTALIEIHKQTVPMSGSVRHYADDSNSPDGTFDAKWDYVNKTVIPPSNESVGSFLKGIWNKVRTFFSKFKIASRQVDVNLAKI
jgi:hypothetical protein